MYNRNYPEIVGKRDNSSSLVADYHRCEHSEPQDTVTDRLNNLLSSNGPGYVLKLCPGEQYQTTGPISFAAPNQEISTAGYPTGDRRAKIIVSGSTANDGSGHTTAIDGTCSQCSGIILRNVEIDGNRAGAPPIQGGANIEMGGSNSDQIVENIYSHDPRGWSCLHIIEGALDCNNTTVQNNYIGPCGSDASGQWADGISMSCANSVVRNNLINNPTDGGVVLFGAPGTRVENNTIWVEKHTLLGGINMVDYLPWNGDYTDTVVTNNFILGGFATGEQQPGEERGTNVNNALIKIGIAVGPRTWFGNNFGDDISSNGTVMNNKFSGAFSYAMAVSSASGFNIQDNTLVGNTAFIGNTDQGCGDSVPPPASFVVDMDNVQSSSIQSDFQDIQDGDNLICVTPPAGSDQWPFGNGPGLSSLTRRSVASLMPGSPVDAKGNVAFGAILVLTFVVAFAFWALKRSQRGSPTKQRVIYSDDMEQI